MKNTILILIPFLVLTGCGKTVDLGDLQERDGVYYEVGSDVGYTGKFEGCRERSIYSAGFKREIGEACEEGNLKDGKRDGLVTFREPSTVDKGCKKREVNYKDGLREGTDTCWYTAGRNKRWEWNWKNGEKEAHFIEWYDNGQIKLEGSWSKATPGDWKGWEKNGEQYSEKTLRNILAWQSWKSKGCWPGELMGTPMVKPGDDCKGTPLASTSCITNDLSCN